MEECWGNDATSGTLIAEEFPKISGDELAERWGARAVRGGGGGDEVERPLEEKIWVGQLDGVCPSDVLGRSGCCGWWKLDTFVVGDNAVSVGGVAMPEWPPASMVFWQGAVGAGRSEEVAIITTCGFGV